jgi:small subunit ribosomal protein S1
VNSEIPALPNEAPKDLSHSGGAGAEQGEPVQPGPAESVAEDVVAQTQPPGGGLSDEPAMPAMPAMPAAGDDFDDDDIEIPDEDELEALMTSPTHPEQVEGGVIEGTIVSTRGDGVFVDVGDKTEAFLAYPSGRGAEKPDWNPGDRIEVVISGRSAEGYIELQSTAAQRPSEFYQLEGAFEAGSVLVGKVLESVRGGLAIDVGGARGFLPASRSGERDQESLEALIGQEIRFRIAQLDIEDRNVVLDRRSIVDEERREQRRAIVEGLSVGDVVKGVVRNIRDFGAFVDIGGVDALLHISDISWARVDNVSSELKLGDELDVKVLRIAEEGRRIAVGRKQLEDDPWTALAEKFAVGDRIKGRVTRLKDFGAFVELVPGAEGLIHVSEMSWARRIQHSSDVLSVGESVEAVILDLNAGKRRAALGLKQALGDPWEQLEKEHPIGSVVQGTVRKTTNFGAFVEVIEGVEGLLHVSDITSERRLNHPNEIVKSGQIVSVKILEIDRGKRRLKLGMKQLEPTEIDKYVKTVQVGDTVSGRVLCVNDGRIEVELDEGVKGVCTISAPAAIEEAEAAPSDESSDADVSSLTAKLQAAWKGDAAGGSGEASDDLQTGELRSFKITRVDAATGAIELELV